MSDIDVRAERAACKCNACVEYTTFMRAMDIAEDPTCAQVPLWVEYALASDEPLRECEVWMEKVNREMFIEYLNDEANEISPEEMAHKIANREEKWVIASIIE